MSSSGNMASPETASSTSGNCESQSTLSMRFVIGTLQAKWPKVQNISTQILHEWLESQEGQDSDALMKAPRRRKTIVLDTRPLEEYQISHIKGAIRVCPDATDVAQTVEKICEAGSEPCSVDVVCYCSLGYRSCRYADSLNVLNSKMGPESHTSMKCINGIYNLEGSLFKWANENRPMINIPGLPVKHVHQYSVVWGKLLRKELRTWVPVVESQNPQ